jgi:hypothetical protein
VSAVARPGRSVTDRLIAAAAARLALRHIRSRRPVPARELFEAGIRAGMALRIPGEHERRARAYLAEARAIRREMRVAGARP